MVKTVGKNTILCEAEGKRLQIVVKDEDVLEQAMELAEVEMDRALYPEEEELAHQEYPNFYNSGWISAVTDAIMLSGIDAEVYEEKNDMRR